MTYSGPFRGWDPFRPLDNLNSLWTAATAGPASSGSAGAYRTLFMTLRRLVVGRRLTVRLDSGDVAMTVTEFDSGLDVRGLAVGQLDDVRLSANEISWNGRELDQATAVLHNVHLRPATPPVLVAAPVELSLEVPADIIEELFQRATPRLTGQISADGVARVRLAHRPNLGHLEVDAAIDGSALALKPRKLSVRRARWNLPARIPAYRVPLPELPHDLELTDVSLRPEGVVLTGRLPEWRMDVPNGRLEDVVNQLNGMGRSLNLTRFNPMRGD